MVTIVLFVDTLRQNDIHLAFSHTCNYVTYRYFPKRKSVFLSPIDDCDNNVLSQRHRYKHHTIIIIIITSHRLITRWGRLRLLLGSTCSQFLSSFSFYRRRYLHPFPSNILTNDVFSTVRMSRSRQLSR